MALKKKGNWWHASTAEYLDQYLLRHVLGRHCHGVPHQVTHARCAGCGAGAFDLFVDDGERVLRVCTACKAEHKVCDLDRKCDADSAGEIVCSCMYSECEVAVGFALMDPPEGEEEGPVGHLYVAGQCTECGLCGVYSEWSPEGDYPFAEMAKSV
ncbi:unnamed protein product [uncultured bacterium]|nr:unnamed protein product [uncultured bacterium]